MGSAVRTIFHDVTAVTSSTGGAKQRQPARSVTIRLCNAYTRWTIVLNAIQSTRPEAFKTTLFPVRRDGYVQVSLPRAQTILDLAAERALSGLPSVLSY